MPPDLASRLDKLRAAVRVHKLSFAAITRFSGRVDRRAMLIQLDNRLNRDLDELEDLYRVANLLGKPRDEAR
jgi:hypothetical protein